MKTTGCFRENIQGEEYCPKERLYQRPLAHGWDNPCPSAEENLPCDLMNVAVEPPLLTDTHTLPSPVDRDASPFAHAPVISAYTRQDALDDGTLVLVPKATQEEYGITFSVALTRTVWEEYVAVPSSVEGFQDETGRLGDILLMFHLKARDCDESKLSFEVLVQQTAGEHPPITVQLKAVVDAGDYGHGAITIMLPHES